MKYPSSEKLLEIAIKEYEIESTRKRDLESRVGVMIGIIGVLLGLYTSTLSLSKITFNSNIKENIGVVFIIFMCITPVILLLITLKKMVDLLSPKNYDRINIYGVNEENATKNFDEICFDIANQYKEVVINNQQVNYDKAESFNQAIKLLYFSIMSIIIMYFLNQFIEKIFN